MYFSSFIFKENRVFNEEDNPSQKVVLVEEELDDTDIDGIQNLEDLRRLVFVDEECGNLKIVDYGGELTRNIDQRNKYTMSSL